MRLQTITLLLAAALLLSGCASQEQETVTADDSDATATDDADTNVTEDNGAAENGTTEDNADGEANNTAPTAILEASAVNGTAPLNVTFTLDGSDADGDNLTWTLHVNGSEAASGDVLPATVNQTFEAGNHTVTLVVHDGEAEDIVNVTLFVDAAQAAEPELELQATWTGLVWDPTCFVQDGHTVPESYWGMEYRVTAGWADGMYMDFWDASIENGVGTSDTQIGIIPDDAGNAWLCLGDSTSPGEYTVEIWG